MPTASTSQILGNNECFEPFTNNVYTRRTIAGDYIIANKHMIRELLSIGVWTEDVKNSVIERNGSIQHITTIPQHIRNKYKIVWEIPMKHMIDMACDRGAFICQSQSLNLWQPDPNYKNLTSMHFYSWEKDLRLQFTIFVANRERHRSNLLLTQRSIKTPKMKKRNSKKKRKKDPVKCAVRKVKDTIIFTHKEM